MKTGFGGGPQGFPSPHRFFKKQRNPDLKAPLKVSPYTFRFLIIISKEMLILWGIVGFFNAQGNYGVKIKKISGPLMDFPVPRRFLTKNTLFYVKPKPHCVKTEEIMK